MTSLQTTLSGAYDDLGAGDPALLLLPGWCGDRSVFGPMATLLAGDHRVLVADLDGQGGLAHHTEDFDSEEQVENLVAVVEDLGLDRVVPVALSHAGWFAIDLRRRLGAERVPGVVLLDWMVLGTPPGFTDALAGLQAPQAWQDVRGALFGMWTEGVGARAVHDYVASMGEYGFDHWSRAGREIAAGFAREGSPVDALSRLEEACPTLHLYAQPVDDDYLAAQLDAAARLDWFDVVRLDACSHFPMLEVPGAITGHITEFVNRLR